MSRYRRNRKTERLSRAAAVLAVSLVHGCAGFMATTAEMPPPEEGPVAAKEADPSAVEADAPRWRPVLHAAAASATVTVDDAADGDAGGPAAEAEGTGAGRSCAGEKLLPSCDEASGAAVVETRGPEAAAVSYIGFMKQAAAADGPTLERMKRELRRRSEQAPLRTRVQMGFLLTSPMETDANVQEGQKMLRELLGGESDLPQDLRDLIEVRLQEVAVRQALRIELSEAKGKIEDLLSIESSMEQRKNGSQDRSR